MKTLEQLTQEAAVKAASKLVGLAPELQIEKFISGAEWERNRDKEESEKQAPRIAEITSLLKTVVEEYDDVQAIAPQNIALIRSWIEDNPSGMYAMGPGH